MLATLCHATQHDVPGLVTPLRRLMKQPFANKGEPCPCADTTLLLPPCY